MFRAYAARQRVIPLRAEREKAERRRAEELRATAVLQSAARTRAARRAVTRRRAEILEATRREQGVLTIQVHGVWVHGMCVKLRRRYGAWMCFLVEVS